jgi:4-diphosphocytidyl-2-C-methyl-D-erythritol kinase
MTNDGLILFAPAKINLFLHITGKRDDGYHTLQSLMAFMDIGDTLEFMMQDDFQLEVTGPFAGTLPAQNDNLIYKAARLLAAEYQVSVRGKITLTKNLPVASGIGGGSADAAAALKGLSKLWRLPEDPMRLRKIALTLGADVPACIYANTVWAEGIGDQLKRHDMPVLHMVLVNPLVPVSTAAAFKNFNRPFSKRLVPPGDKTITIDDLKSYRNDLTEAAIAAAPVIKDVLAALEDTPGCLLHRLSGSGATCFGLYDSAATAGRASSALAAKYKDWWVAPGQSV